jgi:Uma2 family endonuclease
MAAATGPIPSATATRVAIVASWHNLPLRVRAAAPLSDDELYDFCSINRDLHIERTSDGEIIIMPPTGAETGRRNAELTAQLVAWAKRDGRGIVFDSSTGFILDNGAERSPDVSWVRKDRWEALSPDQRSKFPHLTPDFVAELRSPSDDLDELDRKMKEYIACGTQLGWLIDPSERSVYVCRPGADRVTLAAPDQLDGAPELPGLVVDLRGIW